MTRARPRLSPESRARRSKLMKQVHAADLSLRKRLGRAAASAFRRRAKNPDYLKWRRDILAENTLSRMRAINNRAANEKRWSDPQMKQRAREQLAAQRADPAFHARSVAARWTPEARARQSRQKKAFWAARRGFAIPRDQHDAYMHLIRVKKLSAGEAGAVLGLIPSEKPCTLPEAEQRGMAACLAHEPGASNPFPRGDMRRPCWAKGWRRARRRQISSLRSEMMTAGLLRKDDKRRAEILRIILGVLIRHRLSLHHLIGRSRHKTVLCARFAAVQLLRGAEFSYPAIGRLLGRDHSTIIHAMKHGGKWA